MNICRENNIEITGSVYLKPAEEIKRVVNICRKNNIEITGSIFVKSYNQLKENIEFIKTNYDESYLLPLIVSKNIQQLMSVMPYLQELGILETVKKSASILLLALDEIKERQKILEDSNQPLVLENGRYNSIFGLSKKKYAEYVKNMNNKKIKKRSIYEY